METKELILNNALDMFAKAGYDSVSIRDIARSVNIKESSIYYHFKNKHDILELLVVKYENHIKGLTDKLQASMNNLSNSNSANSNSFSWDWLREFYFEQYLFDSFCNQMMRLLMLEQFHNEHMRSLYENYLFELPYTIQTQSFLMLSRAGFMNEQQAIKLGKDFYAAITMLTFKYLLNGELTDRKKNDFCEEAFSFVNRMFQGE